MSVSEKDIYRTSIEQIIISEEDDGIYIYNFTTGKEFKTNETGKEILERCNGKRNTNEIVKELAKKHEENQDAVLQDVKNFLELALKEGLVKEVKNEK